MADMSKAERLAAARKKLQDFQRKKESHSASSSIAYTDPQSGAFSSNVLSTEKHTGNGTLHVTNTLPSPSISSNTLHGTQGHEPFEDTVEISFGTEKQSGFNGTNAMFLSSQEAPLQDIYSNNSERPSTATSETQAVLNASSYFSSNENSSTDVAKNHGSLQEYFSPTQDFIPSSTAHLFATSYGQNDKWDLNPGSQDMAKGFSMDSVSSSSLNEQISANHSSMVPESDSAQMVLCPSGSVEEIGVQDRNENKSTTGFENVGMVGVEDSEILLNGRSSTESIRQLTDQITQLMDPSMDLAEKNNSHFALSLETRNQELAAQLAAERQANQHLQFSLRESQSQVSHLELKMQELQSEQEIVLARHLSPLQEQLRAHAQTVGILVGEKTELEAALAHHTTTAKQHASEVEELQSRLSASRHRVSELEKELATLTAAASVADKQKNSQVHEVDQLRLQNGMLSKQLEDAEQEVSELRQKLSSRVSEVGSLTAQLQDKHSQLSLAQLRITQLSASDNPEASAEIESLHQLKISLERRCNDLTETVRQLTADRDQADQQYKQYVAQLNGQLQAANSKLESLSIENEKLRNREEDLVQNMSELERQMQQQIQLHQHQQVQYNKMQQQGQQQNELGSDNQSTLLERIAELEEKRQTLQLSFDSKVQELSSLQGEMEEREGRIAELEAICSERPDQSRLMAAMESDKVAAAQATSQNAKLKQQLQELQEGFIKMSNDKLNLTENLEHERHVNKEMGEKISQLAEELHELRILVSDKERRLQEYRELEHEHNHSHSNCNEPHEHNHDHSNCNDPHKHNHDHEHNQDHDHCNVEDPLNIQGQQNSHGAFTLQDQLNQAQEHIHNLNSQNNSLRHLIAQKSTESHESGSSSSATEGATTDDAAADHETNCEDASDGHTNHRYLKFAMEKLQERFTRTMSEVAELTDEKQRLEHLVLQLQDETETIGEYVTLYQKQRAALQQKAREKDHQLANLSAEREELRHKLFELNVLVHRLLEERGLETAKEALPLFEVSNESTINANETADVIEIPNVAEAVSQEANANQDAAKQLSKKILSIIEEINVSNDVEASFHPCPWCSGRLKNV